MTDEKSPHITTVTGKTRRTASETRGDKMYFLNGKTQIGYFYGNTGKYHESTAQIIWFQA